MAKKITRRELRSALKNKLEVPPAPSFTITATPEYFLLLKSSPKYKRVIEKAVKAGYKFQMLLL